MTTQRNTDVQSTTETDTDTPVQTDHARDETVLAQAEDGHETRPLPVVADAPIDEEKTPAVSAPAIADESDHDDDVGGDEEGDPTVVRPVVRPEAPSRPRKTTLAVAISRPVVPSGESGTKGGAGAVPAPAPKPAAKPEPAVPEGIADEVDEWSLADQPTVYLSPKSQQRQRADDLANQEAAVRPSVRPAPQRPADGRPPAPTRPTQRPAGVPSGARPDIGSRPVRPAYPADQRLAAPDGRPIPPTPAGGVPRAALPNPRMERFQALRRQRMAHADGSRDSDDARPVAEVVRQWWSDLVPGLERALEHQREARASGIHPIPAHEPAPTTRLGDAFGRLTASAREFSDRAQAVAGPRLKRLHEQAEQAAQALVERIEGSPTRQQAPFLGPGRIAVFFKQGVTVGQAQRLLAASHARPIRLIPRKHGFLALVPPGAEAEIGARLREHPYVRDTAYLTYDEYGEAVEPS